MKISEKQVLELMCIAQVLISKSFAFNDFEYGENIAIFLKTIRDQQSNELREVE